MGRLFPDSKKPEQLVVDPRAIGILIDGNKDAALQKQIADTLGKLAMKATETGRDAVALEAIRKLGDISSVTADRKSVV